MRGSLTRGPVKRQFGTRLTHSTSTDLNTLLVGVPVEVICCVRAKLRFDGRTVDQRRYRCDAAVAEVIEDVLREAESFAVQ